MYGLTDDLNEEREARQRMQRALEAIKAEATNTDKSADQRLLRIVAIADVGLYK